MKKLTIKDWAEDDRPREKVLLRGITSLSNAELLAILIGSGNNDESAIQLSQRILNTVNNNLYALGKLSLSDLTTGFKGIGMAKGVTILAALELGRRRREAEPAVRLQITCSRDVYDLFFPLLAALPTALSFLCTTQAIQYIGSTPTAILGALEPLTALFFGVLLFGETLTVQLSCGIILILVAVTLIIAGNNISPHLIRFRKLFPKLPLRKNKTSIQ